MPPDELQAAGAFAEALVDAERIRRFLDARIRPLKEEEESLAKPWRSGFRGKLPFFALLDQKQQGHLRGIFSHMLPNADVDVEAFDREERILLDVLSETYIAQARVFVELMEEHHYRVISQVRRDAPGRVIALTLSASVFMMDAPDAQQKRRYRYQNIYGNRHVTPDGRCRLKGHFRLGEMIRALEFRSSPLLMLAVHPEGARYKMAFGQESQVVSDTMTSRMMEVAFHASSTFHSYTNVRSMSEIQAEDNDEDEEEGLLLGEDGAAEDPERDPDPKGSGPRRKPGSDTGRGST